MRAIFLTFFILSLLLKMHGEASGVITSIPKSGTHFFNSLMKELQIPVPCTHYALNTDESQSWHAQWAPWHLPLLRTPDSFNGPTVVVVRDLRDVMSSACYWVEQIAKRGIYCPADNRPDLENHYRLQASEYLNLPVTEQLVRTIDMTSLASAHMLFTKHSIELILRLIKDHDQVFVVRFEDFIGEESGGRLTDKERNVLISEMCHFLGYERSPRQVKKAIQVIFGHSNSFNPVKAKVGRWKNEFSSEHIQRFQALWDDYNIALGYPSIVE
ncbi:MAG: hypothetical protein S4CHLAM2_18770 [Chlamydiales bacterium]|nr:hypothetical protein [Chlamydiales bacterium]